MVILFVAIAGYANASEPLVPDLERIERELHQQQEQLDRQREQLERQEYQLEEQRRELERLRDQRTNVEPTSDDSESEEASAVSSLPQLPGIWEPRGDTQVGVLDRFSLGLGIQYRVMYNAGNIPGPGGTTFANTDTYDFFRQRLRVNLSLAPKGFNAGGFVQAEFRGGFGGSSPNVSDPRADEPSRNPFNSLEARGIRYGYLYAEPMTGHTLLAGVLPMSDEFGDTLFSADWDFSVGGVALLGSRGPASYRLAYLRLVEGVGATDADTIAEDGDFVLADVLYDVPRLPDAVDTLRLGMHAYYLDVGKGLPLGATEEAWLGVTASADSGPLGVNTFALLNTGRLGIGELDENGQVVSGFDANDAHTGYAFKLEATAPLGPLGLAVQALYASGDRADDVVHNRFITPQGLLGTEGYWAYTHIFTANPPSDVNDLAVEIGNDGAGLVTVQGRVRAPLHRRVDLELSSGWFQSAHRRNGSRDMGIEIGGLTSVAVSEGLSLDVGAAGAFLGDFFDPDADDLFEVFTRLQFQY